MGSSRLARLTTAMVAQGLDAMALVPGANLRYLTGLSLALSERLTLALVPADKSPPCVVLPALELGSAKASASSDTLRFFAWNDADGPTDALSQAVKEAFRWKGTGSHLLKVGIEYTSMRVMELRALERACNEHLPWLARVWEIGGSTSGIQTVDALPVLSGLRMVKDAQEQAAMAEAVRMVETALHNTLNRIVPGVTERQLAAHLTSEILAAGAEGESFGCLVASGPNSANPHHAAGERALQPGDLIILDAGARHAGYVSDITRTVALGEPGTSARRIYDIVLAANAAGRAAVRPGTTGEQVDQMTRQVIEDAGYGGYFVHRTGHGLGLEVHEPPYIVAGKNLPLLPGTTLTIEPGIYLEGVGGVRIEDDVLVTETGGHSLTTFGRDLLVLPVP